jgi:hypothetical protein
MIGTLQSRPNFKVLLFASALIAITLFAVIMFIYDKSSIKAIGSSASKLTIVIAMISLLWLYFEKWGWRQIPFFGALVRKWPDLNGRWEGTIDREGTDPSHRFVLEIRQNLTKLQCDTYSEHGESHSIIASITVDEQAKQFYLCYNWLGGTSAKYKKSQSGEFYGTTILRLCGDKNERKFEGRYFTERRPHQTRGTLHLSRCSKEVKGSFS